ncbi:hypothetical protein ACIPSA_43965 [Streptomyces sp. NPDC086549]|uniref:hypothetical protein n=1 Tax=Streptomyces sp. NPDC086549 TaxID=3365752 RepID=UPI003814C93B
MTAASMPLGLDHRPVRVLTGRAEVVRSAAVVDSWGTRRPLAAAASTARARAAPSATRCAGFSGTGGTFAVVDRGLRAGSGGADRAALEGCGHHESGPGPE